MGFSIISLNIELKQDDRTVCCNHKIVCNSSKISKQAIFLGFLRDFEIHLVWTLTKAPWVLQGNITEIARV